MNKIYHCFYCGLTIAREHEGIDFLEELEPAIELLTIKTIMYKSIYICWKCFKQNAPEDIIKELANEND